MNNQKAPRASIIIPAFNESASIGYVIDGCAALSGDYQIIVINDGSTDGTGEILNKMSATVWELAGRDGRWEPSARQAHLMARYAIAA